MSTDNKTLEDRIDSLSKKLDRMESVAPPFYAGLSSASRDDEIDLRELWNVIWQGKWIIIGVTLLFAIASVVYALSLPNIYTSSALLAPSEESRGGGMSALAGQFGGLASLAGINVKGGGGDKIATSIEVIMSRRFAENLIEKYKLLVPLMAVEGWSRSDNKLKIDKDIYDEHKGKWVRDVTAPKKAEPSTWEAYKVFRSIVSVSQQKDTGFVTLSVEHMSPYVAQEWVAMIVKEINAVVRYGEVVEAEKSIEYLTSQLDKTPIADMRTVFYQLIEEQSKTIMLAEVREEYVFKTLDPAVVAEEKTKPKRALILILGCMLGGILGCIVVFIRKLIKKQIK